MIDLPDPVTLLSAWKTSVDAVKGAIDLLGKIIPASGANQQQKQALENALLTASSSAALAEAEIGKAYGYEFCRCTLPPTPMLTVGYFTRMGAQQDKKDGDPVYECPKCGFTNSGPFAYTRTAPPRKK